MARVPDPLSAVALVYAGLPSLVFLLGWLEPAVGVPVAFALALALASVIRTLPDRQDSKSIAALGFLAALALGWGALAGGGHLAYANKDWITRDAVYADLVLTAWPPAYGWHDGAPLVLRTAMGFFLPPALAAKLLGIAWGPSLLFLWTSLGAFLFLALLPLPRRFGPGLVVLSMLPVLFSGMDVLGIVLALGHAPMFPLPLEWWSKWAYSSLTAQLFWAPNHALALFVGSALFFRHRNDPSFFPFAVMLLPVLLMWTPFAPIGLLPWLAWVAWRGRDVRRGLARVPWFQWVAAIALSGLIGALFTTPGVPAAFSTPATAGGAWDIRHETACEVAIHYLQFVGCEFLILALVLFSLSKSLREELVLATLILLAIPLVRFGPSNDWVLRVSTPSLVILMIVTMHVVETGLATASTRRKSLPLLLVLAIGAATPAFEISRALLWRRSAPNYGVSLLQDQRGYLAPHYIGRLEGSARIVLFRMPARVPESGERLARVPASLRLR